MHVANSLCFWETRERSQRSSVQLASALGVSGFKRWARMHVAICATVINTTSAASLTLALFAYG